MNHRDKMVIRELAAQVAEIAALPVQLTTQAAFVNGSGWSITAAVIRLIARWPRSA